MSDRKAPPPSDDELIAFARQLLGDLGGDLTDTDLLRDTVTDARDLWVLLDRANQDGRPRA